MSKKTQQEIDDRIKELKRHQVLFDNGKDEISNEKFDELEEELREWDPENDYFNDFGNTSKGGKLVQNAIPMRSTKKAYKASEIENWVKTVIKEAASVGVKNPTFRVTPKLDGVAGQYNNGVMSTRGNGAQGQDISSVLKDGVRFVGKTHNCVGEIVAVNSYFYDEIYPVFAHPRNMISGYVGSDTIHDAVKKTLSAKKIHFVPYSTLENWKGSGADLLKKIGTITEDLRKKVDYPLDGMVAEVLEDKVKEVMGATGHHNRWQLAIKQRGEVAETVINDIAWQTGKTGKVTPVLRIKPVTLDGAVLSNVTASNAQKVLDDGLGVGAKVVITRSGGVIPALVEVKTKAKKVSIPDKCPSCGKAVVMESDFLKCKNNNCSARTQRGLFYFFKTIETAKGFGEKSLETLTSNNYNTLSDIFDMSKKDFEDIGFGSGQASNLRDALDDALNTEIEDARFLAAFAIEKLAIGTARQLLEKFKWEELPNLKADEIEKLDGFAKTKATAIVAGLEARWSEIEGLRKKGFTLQTTIPSSDSGEATTTAGTNPISGKTIRFTGTMTTGKRSDMEKQARALGAKTIKNVSKSLGYLVYGEKAGGSLEEAQALGVTCLSETEYLALMKDHLSK